MLQQKKTEVLLMLIKLGICNDCQMKSMTYFLLRSYYEPDVISGQQCAIHIKLQIYKLYNSHLQYFAPLLAVWTFWS